MLQAIIMYQSTNVLISNVSGPNDVTAYNISYKLISVTTMVFNIILGPLWPAFTDAYTKKDYDWMSNVYQKMIKLYLLSACALVLMVVLSPIIYNIWIGNRANIPLTMTIAVAIYILVNNWLSLQVLLINGIGTIQLQLYMCLIGMFLHIPLSLVLGKYIGAYGVLSSLIIITIIYSMFMTLQIKKILRKKAVGIWIK